MILRLFQRETPEPAPGGVEDIVLGGIALAEKHLDRGNLGEAYAMVPQLERLYQHAGYEIERERGINRVVLRITGWKYDHSPDPTFPDAA